MDAAGEADTGKPQGPTASWMGATQSRKLRRGLHLLCAGPGLEPELQTPAYAVPLCQGSHRPGQHQKAKKQALCQGWAVNPATASTGRELTGGCLIDGHSPSISSLSP